MSIVFINTSIKMFDINMSKYFNMQLFDPEILSKK